MVLQPEIDSRAVDHVRNTLEQLYPGDEITITVEAADAHQADPIISILDTNGFDYQSKGGHDGRSYHINARRKPS
ncbi:MAG: hypothetical protein JL56_10840 [Desulfotomaculum sp. BICA1-6]|nr:MAG: hypothetical protein VR67_07005 [Peptococcaceae bacterium BRH_c8a]KJS73657.1 MAG: hypothetical protein JL56_10840 [Desulfotomaculum sp. BICA1-6]